MIDEEFDDKLYQDVSDEVIREMWQTPTDMINNLFFKMREHIIILEMENRKLKAELSEMRDSALKETNQLTARMLQMALHGALPREGTPEYKNCGYGEEEEEEEEEKESTISE